MIIVALIVLPNELNKIAEVTASRKYVYCSAPNESNHPAQGDWWQVLGRRSCRAVLGLL